MTATITNKEIAKLLNPTHDTGEVASITDLVQLLTSKVNEDTLKETNRIITIQNTASLITDGLQVTISVLDGEENQVLGIQTLNVYISDDADGSGLTATTADGDLTATVGTILSVLTPKKHIIANTNANGTLRLVLVDSANTVGERICVVNPINGKITVGDATLSTDYQGGM